jgi:lipopolysaccharide export system protein LptA
VKTRSTFPARGPVESERHPGDRGSRVGSGAPAWIFVATVAALLSVLPATEAPAQKGPSPSGPSSSGPPPQGLPNALQGFSQNRDQPVKIQADNLVVRDKDKVATFSGNVHVTQGDTEMHSKVLVVYYVDPNKPAPVPATTMKTAPPGAAPGAGEQQQIRRIEATGGVLVTQKGQNAVGENGIFDMQSNTVTLNGNVVVTHDKDVVRGQRLVVDLGTGVSRIDGGRVDALFGSAPKGEITMPGQLPRPSQAN